MVHIVVAECDSESASCPFDARNPRAEKDKAEVLLADAQRIHCCTLAEPGYGATDHTGSFVGVHTLTGPRIVPVLVPAPELALGPEQHAVCTPSQPAFVAERRVLRTC